MATPETWTKYENEFDRLLKSDLQHGRQSRVQGINAVYYPPLPIESSYGAGVRVPGVAGTWELWLKPGAEGLPADQGIDAFKQLAWACAVADGCPEHSDAWVYWVMGIAKRRVAVSPVYWGRDYDDGGRDEIMYADVSQHDGDHWQTKKGNTVCISFSLHSCTIENICYRSIEYCRDLAAQAARGPHEFAPRVPEQANETRAAERVPVAWFRGALEKKHGSPWSYYEATKWSGIAKRTLEKLLADVPVSEKVVAKVKKAYGSWGN